MRSKILLLVFACALLTSLLAEATMIRGSVGNQGSRRFTFVPDFSGTVLLHLVFDNRNSDLDLQLGYTLDNGEIQLVAISQSTLQNFEQLEIGILGGLEYNIFVVSDRGPSPFRLNFDGTFTTSATSAPGKAGGIQLKEAPIDAGSTRFLENNRNRTKALKK